MVLSGKPASMNIRNYICIRIWISANPCVIRNVTREAKITPKKLFENDRIFILYINLNLIYIYSHISFDFIVIADCARKFIYSTLGSGNEECLHSKNIWKSISDADMQAICRNCRCRISAVPIIPVWVANSLGLNSIDSFNFNRVYYFWALFVGKIELIN
jgi:hypothetical protein